MKSTVGERCCSLLFILGGGVLWYHTVVGKFTLRSTVFQRFSRAQDFFLS